MIRRPITLKMTVAALLALSGCAAAPPPSSFPEISYATWTDAEPPYRLYPGDVLDVATPSAPELGRTVTVQPDGRISLPLIAPVMVGDRTGQDAERAVSAAYARVLQRPDVEIAVKTSSPLKVFVGGEVDKPGVYDMPGDINALQAIFMAGGFKVGAHTRGVIVIRRGPDGRAMMKTINLDRAAKTSDSSDATPLRRFDVIYVPRSGVAAFGVFVQQYLRDTLPIQFSYAFNSNYVTTR